MKKLAIVAWVLAGISFIWLSVLACVWPNIFSWNTQNESVCGVLWISLVSAYVYTGIYIGDKIEEERKIRGKK